MSFLDFVPKWLLLGLIAVFGVVTGVQTARLAAAQRTLYDLRESILKARELRQEQNEIQREIERARSAAIAKAQDRAHEQLAQVQSDRQRLAAAVQRLRDAARPVPATGESRGDPAVAEGGAAATGPGLVFADVFSRSGERLRSCAAALDESRIAGQLCERAYDAVTQSHQQGAEHGTR